LSASTPWTDPAEDDQRIALSNRSPWRLCQRAKRRRRGRRAPRVPARQAGPARCAQTSIRPRQRLPSQPEDSARSVTYRLRCRDTRSVTYRLRCRDRCHQQQLSQHSWPSGYRCWGCQLPPQARWPAAAAGSGAPVVLSVFGRAAARPHSRGVRKNCPPIELERRRVERLGGLPSREAEDVSQDQDGLKSFSQIDFAFGK
jgi:hypothetical protein